MNFAPDTHYRAVYQTARPDRHRKLAIERAVAMHPWNNYSLIAKAVTISMQPSAVKPKRQCKA
ncbi:hypothetical protein ACWX0D_33315, partial [Pseudomonas aeruginosa]